jgi:outer membrane protein TolC
MEIKKVLSASLDRAKSNLKKMSLMFSYGKASELDKIKSESIVLNLASDLLMAEQNYNVTLASLKKNIGFPISKDLVLIGDFINEELIDFNMKILLEKMMEFQPGLKYAKQNVELMKENISSVRSELLPNLH